MTHEADLCREGVAKIGDVGLMRAQVSTPFLGAFISTDCLLTVMHSRCDACASISSSTGWLSVHQCSALKIISCAASLVILRF